MICHIDRKEEQFDLKPKVDLIDESTWHSMNPNPGSAFDPNHPLQSAVHNLDLIILSTLKLEVL